MCTANQALLTYVDIVKKELSTYLEQNTLYFENVANITGDSDIISPHKKQNGRQEDSQESFKIPFEKMRQIRA